MKPLVSVIVSTYNSEQFLRGRLEDLVNQTVFPEIEVIVVNSGSQQNEEEIVKEFQERHSNIHYLSSPQRETIYRAWNRGIAVAKGEFIANANTDDRSRVDALELFANALESHPHAAMVYADQFVTSVPNSPYEASMNGKRNVRFPFSRIQLLAGYFLGSQQMWRASLHFEEQIWFDEHFEVTGDYDFACRVAELHELLLVKDVLGVYYLSETKRNKQFQNPEQFLTEDCQVRQKYVRRYLDSLSDEQFNNLYKIVRFWTAVPRWIFTVIHRGISLVDERKQIKGKIFWCWLGSHIEERRGNIRAAKSLCRQWLEIPAATIIRYRYQELSERYA